MVSKSFKYAGFHKAFQLGQTQSTNSQSDVSGFEDIEPLEFFEDLNKYNGRNDVPKSHLKEYSDFRKGLTKRMRMIVGKEANILRHE